MKQDDVENVKEHLPELEETLRYLCSLWHEPGVKFDMLHHALFYVITLRDLLDADS